MGLHCDVMNCKEAIAKLESMQRQVIHGSNVFKEIANVIREAKEIIEQVDTDSEDSKASKWLNGKK